MSNDRPADLDANDLDAKLDGLARRLALEELFEARSPEEWRAAYAAAFDLGPDIGRENVRE
jgi:hypothetical protein